jgi:hypothetical protein
VDEWGNGEWRKEEVGSVFGVGLGEKDRSSKCEPVPGSYSDREVQLQGGLRGTARAGRELPVWIKAACRQGRDGVKREGVSVSTSRGDGCRGGASRENE